MKKLYIITISIITISIAFFAYNFFTNQKTQETEASLSRNGLTLDLNFGNNDGTATPTVYDTSGFDRHATSTAGATAPTCNQNNCDFDGGDFISSNATGVFNSSEISIVIKFTPDFNWDDNNLRFLFDTINATQRNYIIKRNNASNNTLDIALGFTVIEQIASDVYSPYWKQNEENILIISADANNDLTDVYLNGVKIVDGDTTAWAPQDSATLHIGSQYNKSFFFDGKMHYLKVWNRLLTDNEIANLSADRQSTTQAPTRKGLIGHWNMDSNDINGTTVYDKSGNNYNANVGVTPTLLTGKINQSLDFSPEGYTAIVQDNADLTPGTKDFTWSTWIKLSATSPNQAFFTKGGSGVGGLLFYVHGGNTFYAYGDNGSIAINSGITPVIGKWYLATLTRVGSTMSIYVDGVYKAQDTSAGADLNLASNLIIGDGSGFFAEIDDVRIYNYALSAQEVANLYNSAKTNYTQAPSKTGLVGHWNMDANDIFGTTVYDKSGQGNHGVGTSIDSDDLVAGKIGQAISFDDTPEKITIPNNQVLDFVDAYTLSAWVKIDAQSNYDPILARASAGVSDIEFYSTATDFRMLHNRGNGGTQDTSTFATADLIAGKWTLVTGTYNAGTTTYKLYFDGVLKGTDTGVLPPIDTDKTWLIGHFISTIYLSGDIDDARIYDYALSAEEVAGLYNSSRKIYMK